MKSKYIYYILLFSILLITHCDSSNQSDKRIDLTGKWVIKHYLMTHGIQTKYFRDGQVTSCEGSIEWNCDLELMAQYFPDQDNFTGWLGFENPDTNMIENIEVMHGFLNDDNAQFESWNMVHGCLYVNNLESIVESITTTYTQVSLRILKLMV
ncbi:MAG: hypothetical protein A2161_05125 [Candidatus Schekmanbacteria bacterium RBG_13_48_7]|uniref:Uncharacterized protein n=1 Tax=Candidatus Schekmanbacteria bacterium RBG_13_48_7 TaxID=1817878 RepID=A0A1F7S3C4_9BACT|nr:MAG: hypothetical protein A2161_05125 [Candidatus Schekmanbacteria bacterium RBG_13_48_7]